MLDCMNFRLQNPAYALLSSPAVCPGALAKGPLFEESLEALQALYVPIVSLL
jgi:hypothetical protein